MASIINNKELVVTYGDTNYRCYYDSTLAKRNYLLIDISKQKIVSKSDNPLDFDEIVWKSIDK